MLKRTYKSYFDEIEPSEKLIALTKEKMNKEKRKNHYSFYKIGTIAACLVLAIIIVTPFSNNCKNSYEGTSNSACNKLQSSFNTGENTTFDKEPSPSDFISFENKSGIIYEMQDSISTDIAIQAKERNFFEKIIDFIKDIFYTIINLF